MTSRQAELINIMLSQHYNSATYKDAYSELRGTCSDALVHPTVTVSASGTANPPPPSTPTPLGPQWWKERQAEARREQIQIIADQNKTIEALKKQIAEDKWHGDIKAGIDNGYRESNKEIIDVLTEHGLYQAGFGGVAKNVRNVALMCVERGKKCDEKDQKIDDLNGKIDLLKKHLDASLSASSQILESLNRTGLRHYDGSLADNVVAVVNQCATQEKKIEEFRRVVRDRNDEIAKLTKRIDVMERAAQTRQQFDETDRLLIKKKDDEIESLQKRIVIRDGFHYRDREIMSELRKQISDLSKQIEVRQGFIQQDREIIAARNTEIANLRKQVSTLTKQVSQRDMTISVLNKEIDQKEVVINVITGQREVAHKNITEINKHLSEEMRETEDLKKQLVTAVNKLGSAVKSGNNLRDVLRGILDNNRLTNGDGLIGRCQHAIALWEENTK